MTYGFIVPVRAVFAALIGSAGAAAAALPDCGADAKVGSICQTQVERLHPTQFALGEVAVECKRETIETKQKARKLDKYLADPERRIPAVVGPHGRLYIVDHHHLSAALYRAKAGDWRGKSQKVQVEIQGNFAALGLSDQAFWEVMAMENKVWAFDAEGKPVDDFGARLAAMDMGDLKDNPYRTLSRWTRESCGYLKKGKDQCLPLDTTKIEPSAPYFMEFYWARFLRRQLELDNQKLNTPAELMDAYPTAMKATLSKHKTDRFFRAQGLDPATYGQNQKGKYLHLDFSAAGCERWWLKND